MFGRSAADAPEAISKKKKTCLIGVNLTPGVRRKNRKLVRLFSFRDIGEIFLREPGEFFQNGIGVHKQQVLLLSDGGEHAIDQVAVAPAPLSGLLGGGGGWIFFARKVPTGCQTSSAYVVLETTTEYSLAAGENVGKISLSARMPVRLRVLIF